MNNLLQSLSSQRLHVRVSDAELKRLLSAVKDGRGHDAKLSDPFYDSLEGVLQDLRTVTIDNRDAEAFLKPVSKTDYPDYYEIIKEPMDLQTMLRKVKQKSYKSKAEFQDDLELIWSNCFVYNTGDNHPLRMCAKRLREKAVRLLKNVTDRRDRLDPPIPVPTPIHGHTPVQPNGIMVNGNGVGHGHGHHSRKHSATPGPVPSKVPTVIVKRPGGTTSRPMSIAPPSPPPPRRESTFADQPAFIRTAMGMSNFSALDRELSLNLDLNLGFEPENKSNNNVAGPSRLPTPITDKLRQIVVADDSTDDFDNYNDDYSNGMEIMNGEVGDKRKLAINGDVRPRKRARTRTRSSGGTTASSSSFNVHGDGMGMSVDGVDGVDPVELWWEATTSNQLMANALPSIPFPPSSSSSFPSTSSTKLDSTLPRTTQTQRIRKKKKRQKRPPLHPLSSQPAPPKSLLGLINNNIRSLRRVRQIHDKFLALNVLDDAGSTLGGSGGGQFIPGESMDSGFRSGLGGGNGNGNGMMDDPEKDDVLVDDRPWRLRLKSLQRGSDRGVRGFRGAGEVREEGGVRGLDVGEEAAGSCLRWMGRKVLEHSGFQSTSKAALDVFTGVASEYLFNVGRTLRYLCDKYSQQMSAEEIILHTLFESGITHIRDLERYITDDVVRYGSRLADLEKKLANAYNEVTVEAALDDDAFFNEDEDEDNELVMGNFADALGVDFFGLGELGIASDLGLQSLTIPKKLLRGKNKQRNAQNGAKPSEPPPPYPPPPQFAPLTPHHADNPTKVIGLLRPFYVQRFNAYSTRTNPGAPTPFITPPPALPSQLDLELAREMGTEEPAPRVLPPVRNTEVGVGVVVLPDDQPPVGRTKSGPLGQVLRPASGAVTKKKVKSGGGGGGGGGGIGGGGMSVHGPAGPDAGIPPPPSISQNLSGSGGGSPRKVGS